jgi:antitoxin component YwqK of YwqJK toxin-antitoxin module
MRLIFFLVLMGLLASPVHAQNKKDSKGRKQGVWEKYYPDGKTMLYTGQFKDDQPVGEFKYYFESGKIKSIVQHETSERSYAWFYFENEQLMSEGQYMNQKKDSVWRNYNAQGFLVSKETFKNNRLNGEKLIYYIQNQIETGEVKCALLETYKDSILHGSCIEFFSSGSKKQQGTYAQGKKVGIWETYHPDGSLATRIKFRDGKAYGYAYAFDEEGTELYKSYWLDGKRLDAKAFDKYLIDCKNKGMIPEE